MEWKCLELEICHKLLGRSHARIERWKSLAAWVSLAACFLMKFMSVASSWDHGLTKCTDWVGSSQNLYTLRQQTEAHTWLSVKVFPSHWGTVVKMNFDPQRVSSNKPLTQNMKGTCNLPPATPHTEHKNPRLCAIISFPHPLNQGLRSPWDKLYTYTVRLPWGL